MLVFSKPIRSQAQPPGEDPKISIRPLFDQDLFEVQEIERASFADHWTFRDFQDVFDTGVSVNYVAMAGSGADEHIAGYVIGIRWPTRFEILNLAVDSRYRRRGIGRQLVDQMLCGRSAEVIADVMEYSVGAQLFFRALGFRAVQIFPERYESGNADYRFRWRPARPTA